MKHFKLIITLLFFVSACFAGCIPHEPYQENEMIFGDEGEIMEASANQGENSAQDIPSDDNENLSEEELNDLPEEKQVEKGPEPEQKTGKEPAPAGEPETKTDPGTAAGTRPSPEDLKPNDAVKPEPEPEPKPKPEEKPEPEPELEPEPEPEHEPEITCVLLKSEEQQMLKLVNQEREKAGVKPLKLDTELRKAARIKSKEMIELDYFSHQSPVYGSPFEMMSHFGITYRAAGENIALNSSVNRAHSSLMNSEGHRKNILNPDFTHVGIGSYRGSKGQYYTQMFIRP